MNRRRFLGALAALPVVGRLIGASAAPMTFVTNGTVEEATVGTYGPSCVVWQKTGPTVVTFPAGARLKQATLDPDGSIVLCCAVGDRFYTMRQDAKGVYR